MKRVSITQDQILDASFYVNSPSAETVWEEEGNRFFVVRNGEMRIHYSPDLESQIVIRYTDQLEEIGVKTDADLEKFTALGDEMFTWVNNSWFEVWDTKDTNYFSEPLFDLNEAIEYAKELLEAYGNNKEVG